MNKHRFTSRLLLCGLHGANYNEGYLIGSFVAIIVFILFYLPLEIDTLSKYSIVIIYVVLSIVVLSNGIFNPLVIYLHLMAFSYKNKSLGYVPSL